MTDEGRGASAAEELALAHEELAAADQLTAALPRIALTRAYFAVFHAMRAALCGAGFEPRTHRGTLHLFNLHFVKTGAFPPDVSRLGSRLQKYREEADYGASFIIDAAGAKVEIDAARAFVEKVAASIVAS